MSTFSKEVSDSMRAKPADAPSVSIEMLEHTAVPHHNELRRATKVLHMIGQVDMIVWGIAGGIRLVGRPQDKRAQALTIDFESGPGSHPRKVYSGYIGNGLFRRHR